MSFAALVNILLILFVIALIAWPPLAARLNAMATRGIDKIRQRWKEEGPPR